MQINCKPIGIPKFWYFFNLVFNHSGKLASSALHETKTTATKWQTSNYAIHVGSIYGLPTKILATIGALFLASLPVTGFLIWLGRKKKSPNQAVKNLPSLFPCETDSSGIKYKKGKIVLFPFLLFCYKMKQSLHLELNFIFSPVQFFC